MAKEAFNKVMDGLKDAKAFMDGAREGYIAHEPLDIKAIRARARMTQAHISFRLEH